MSENGHSPLADVAGIAPDIAAYILADMLNDVGKPSCLARGLVRIATLAQSNCISCCDFLHGVDGASNLASLRAVGLG